MAGVTTPEGIIIPAGGDTYDYLGEQRKMAASQRTIVPVANPAAAATIIAAMAADSRPVSATNPLVTWDDSLKTVITYTGTAYPFGKLDYCTLRNPGAQTFTNSTFTTVVFTAAVEDSNSMWGTPASRIVIKQAGRYHIVAGGGTVGTSGRIATQIQKNGVTLPFGGQIVNTSGGAEISAKSSLYTTCAVGDYITVQLFHETGTSSQTAAGGAYSQPFLAVQQISFA